MKPFALEACGSCAACRALADTGDTEKCRGDVKIVAEMQADEETPGVEEKADGWIERLMAIAMHLCAIGGLGFARELADIARGMLVSEEAALEPDFRGESPGYATKQIA